MSTTENDPLSPPEYKQAASSYRDGNLPEAERLCRLALESSPDCGDALYLLGVIAYEKSDDEAARELLVRATQVNEKNARAFLYLGAACHRSGSAADALAASLSALALEPELPGAHVQLGFIHQGQGDLEKAEAVYRQGLALDPENPRLHDALGTVLHACGRFADAIGVYQSGLEINPQLASLHNNLGSALQEEAEYEAAGNAYQKALFLDPNRAEYSYNLGLNLECRNQLDKAIEEYEHALEKDPRYVKAQLALARQYEVRGQMQRAVEVYQRGIRLAPRNRELHLNLGHVVLDAGRLEEARVCYENVLRIEPDDVDACEGLASIWVDLGDEDKAIAYFERARDLGSITAVHLLAALTHQETQIAPREYVEQMFDSYSDNFEEHLVGALSYQTPRQMFEAFARYVGEDRHFQRSIDLGCGTGLLGLAFQPLVDRLDGVDLSADMLEKAGQKGIYTNLYKEDIVEFLADAREQYDLFMAADVFIYIGNLAPLFLAVQNRATTGAYFVCSTEVVEEGEVELRKTGRYAHSEAYIRSLASAHNFTVLRCSSVPLRKEGEEWAKGQIYIMRYLPTDTKS
jgi:predicted TPR repeat methyltransferase